MLGHACCHYSLQVSPSEDAPQCLQRHILRHRLDCQPYGLIKNGLPCTRRVCSVVCCQAITCRSIFLLGHPARTSTSSSDMGRAWLCCFNHDVHARSSAWLSCASMPALLPNHLCTEHMSQNRMAIHHAAEVQQNSPSRAVLVHGVKHLHVS